MAMPSPAGAAVLPHFTIHAGSLSPALTDLAKQSGIDILFSEGVAGNRTSPQVRGKMTPEAALARLLAGSGLTYHRTADGAFVIAVAADTAAVPTPAADPIPEILVVGRRAQNSDIQRSEDDIQPYQVSSRRTLEDSHSGSLQAFTRSRLPANAQIASPAQDILAGGGSTRSEINLRGLGPAQTLVLVDGRRLPSLPGFPYGFSQPDINGIPIEVVDRIETLTATAGGIYGPGATSGVVNLILQRDYRGAEVSLTSGITTRGDAPEARLVARLGFTPDNGHTDIMVTFSRSVSADLRAGDRDYIEGARIRRYANDPTDFLASMPVGNAINVFASQNLVLDPQFGGIALGSKITSLPLGLGGDVAARNALLVANAGKLDINLPDSLGGQRDYVSSRPSGRAILANLRHRFGSSGVEAIFDVIDTRNNGRLDGRPSPLNNVIVANSPTNPFQQNIALSFPLSDITATQTSDIHVLRYTAGLVVPLPRRWRGNLEYTGGLASNTTHTTLNALGDYLYTAYVYGEPFGGRRALDPLGDWSKFVDALDSYARSSFTSLTQTTRSSDTTFRLAGPLFRLPGGNATLALQAEDRRERIGAAQYRMFDTGTFDLDAHFPRLVQRTSSLAGELRLPVGGDHGLLRQLELQLALRGDRVWTTLPETITLFAIDPPPVTNRNTALAYTAGVRMRPTDVVMLRASISTGILPPTVAQVASTTFVSASSEHDPQRGNRPLSADGSYSIVRGGSAALRPERARSLSAGVVLTPFGDDGPRLSADFTRIDTHDEIGALPGLSILALLADPALYPDRLERAPLTSADAALGFTAGRITRIDLTTGNIARSRLDAVDLTLDYPLSTRRYGDFRFYANATWQPSYWQQTAAGQLRRERIGYSDGPLSWRGNGGVDWSFGALRLGLNGQFYSRYRVTASDPAQPNAQLLAYQGSSHIPAQFYLDFSAAYRFVDGAGWLVPRGAQLRLGILDLFDHSPPIVTDPNSAGYSYYGDARRRRVELTIAVPFGGK